MMRVSFHIAWGIASLRPDYWKPAWIRAQRTRELEQHPMPDWLAIVRDSAESFEVDEIELRRAWEAHAQAWLFAEFMRRLTPQALEGADRLVVSRWSPLDRGCEPAAELEQLGSLGRDLGSRERR